MDFKDATSIVYPTFSGADYQPARDAVRLTGQLAVIWGFMRGGSPWTLREIAAHTGAPESSVSAQLRNLRKPQFGGHTLLKQYIGRGLYTYKLVVNQASK